MLTTALRLTRVTGSDYLGVSAVAAAALRQMREDVLAPEVFGCLQQATATNPGSLAELCRDYLADARQTLELLRQDLIDRDSERVRAHAHYLKGSSQVLGAKEVAKYCLALEGAAKKADFTNAKELVRSTTAAIEAAQAEMAARLGIRIGSVDEPQIKRDELL